MTYQPKRRLAFRVAPSLLNLYNDAFLSISAFFSVEQICSSQRISRKAKVLFELSLKQIKDVIVKPKNCFVVQQNCRGIQSLLVEHAHEESTVAALGDILKFNKKLITVKMNDCSLSPDVVTAVSQLSDLEHLLALDGKNIDGLVDILHCLPKLKRLAIWCEFDHEISGLFPHLESFSVRRVFLLPHFFRNISLKCPRLKIFRVAFSGCTSETLQELRYFTHLTEFAALFGCFADFSVAQNFKNLHNLGLGCLKTGGTTDEIAMGVVQIGRHCKHLRIARFAFPDYELGSDILAFMKEQKSTLEHMLVISKKSVRTVVQAGVVMTKLQTLGLGLWEEDCGLLLELAPNVRNVTCWLQNGDENSSCRENCFEFFGSGWKIDVKGGNPDRSHYGYYDFAMFYDFVRI